MAYYGSSQDLFESEDSDSDATVDLSVPSGTEARQQKSGSIPSAAKPDEKHRSLQRSSKHAISSSDSDDDSRNTGNTCSSSSVNELLLGHMSQKSVPVTNDARTRSSGDNTVAAMRLQSTVTDLSDDRPLCKYGEKCYRRNPNHFREFSHPGNELTVRSCLS